MAITKVTTEVISGSAVTTPKIADNAITAAKIPDGTIATGHIADNAVTAAKIPDNVLTATMLPDNVILATHIPNATNLTLGTVTAALTGNASGTALTVTQAAQTAITSVGTLTSLAITGDLDIADTGAGAITVGGTTNTYNFPVVINATDAGLAISDGTKTIGIWGGHGGSLHAGSGIGTRSNHDMSILTNDTKRSIISSTGKTSWSAGGIGAVQTQARDFTFYTEGVTNGVAVHSNDHRLIFMGGAGSSGAGMDTGYFQIENAGTAVVALNSNGNSYLNGGNVGIGTTGPTAKLHLYTSGAGGINLGIQNSERYYAIETNDGDLKFIDVSAGSVERMSIDSTGIVYICPSTLIKPTIVHSGTIGNLAKLRLINRSGQSADKGGVVELGGVTDDSYTRSDVFGAVGGFKANSTSANRTGYLASYVNTGSALTEAMRIGTNTSNTEATLYLGIDSIWGAGGNAAMAIGGFNGNKGNGIVFKQYSSSASISPMVFYNSGAGTAGSISYTYSSVAYNTSSDYRLKENVQDMTNATALVKQLKPKTFEWTYDPDDTIQYGFLAHEAQAVVPTAVTGEKDATKPAELDDAGNAITGTTIEPQQMDHSKLVPLLVKTIQELEARITTLEG